MSKILMPPTQQLVAAAFRFTARELEYGHASPQLLADLGLASPADVQETGRRLSRLAGVVEQADGWAGVVLDE